MYVIGLILVNALKKQNIMKENKMKNKRIGVCDCGKQLTELDSVMELPAIPYEWYMMKQEEFNAKYTIYYCNKCKIIYRKRKLIASIRYSLTQYWKIIKGLF